MRSLISMALVAVVAAWAPVAGADLEPRTSVTLRALDKITGRATDMKVRVGKTAEFGRLEITARACWQAPPEDAPEAAAFLEITTKAPLRRSLDLEADAAKRDADSEPQETRLFSGWMYASSPGLNALEHPTYDVWVINCNT
jgi:hypothetical protein